MRGEYSMKIFTFWEPKDKLPAYLQLCMKTWEKFIPNADIVLLDYSNLNEYIDISEFGSELTDGRFSLPQIADAIRCMLLYKYGGIWLDCDTIILNESFLESLKLEGEVECSFLGNERLRTVSIAAIVAKCNSNVMKEWIEYQTEKINNFIKPENDFWAYLGNDFINPYCKTHFKNVKILDIKHCWQELSIHEGSHPEKYRKFYFESNHHLADIDNSVSGIMLHNSWTPSEFKNMSEQEFLEYDCTLSNILSEVLDIGEKNKIILYKEDGNVVYNPKVDGLDVKFAGKNNTVYIGKNSRGGNIVFLGNRNICFVEENVDLGSSIIKFDGNDAVIYISSSYHIYRLNICIHDECGLYFGKNNYFNGILNIILSETKNVIIGSGCLFSYGICIRNADPHLVYDIKTGKRKNFSKDIVIGDHVWVGQNCMILKGTQIGSGSVLGSMAVASGKIPSNVSFAGNPGRIVSSDIFWKGDCVHRWLKDMTDKNEYCDSDEYIYTDEGTSNEILEKLDNCQNANMKLAVFKEFSKNYNKNRLSI